MMTHNYPYRTSPSDQYVLYKHGEEEMRGTEGEIWQRLHQLPYSVYHALKCEGWVIRPVEELGT